MLWLMASTCFSQISDDINAIVDCATNEIKLEEPIQTNGLYFDCDKLDAKVAAKEIYFSSGSCAYFYYTLDPNDLLNVYYTLERRNEDGTFTTEAQSDIPEFTALESGAYRIRAHHPVVKASNACLYPYPIVYVLEKGNFDVNDPLGVGGQYDGYSKVSNLVWVDPATQEDIQGVLTSPNGNNVFSPTDDIRLFTAGTQNYKHNWLAIFENGGQNRYISRGWVEDIVEPSLNVKAMWEYHYGSFVTTNVNPDISYTVQYAISNPCNTVWANQNFTFVVCQGNNCKEAHKEFVFSVWPNPADQQLTIGGNTFYQGDQIILHNMLGQEVLLQKVTEVNNKQSLSITHLQPGVYTLWIKRGTATLSNKKVFIKR